MPFETIDDVNKALAAATPEQLSGMFALLAPQLAADNYARAIMAEVQAFRQSANDAVNALQTQATNMIATGDYSAMIQDSDIAAAQAEIVSATVTTTKAKTPIIADPPIKVTG